MIKKQYPIDVQNYPFKVKTDIQLRFNDLDGYGHANNSSMQAFFDIGRAAYLKECCGPDFYKGDSTLLVVSYATDFLRQIRLDDNIEVRVAVHRIGYKSISMIMAIVDKDNGQICAVSDSVMSGFSKRTQASIPILERWKLKISQIENKTF
ncbi:MAG: acyl-CoA thioesterase [Bacteroidales bacterium]|nr:acyl-CoA thioesterase [Bacteroidales bacterium]